MIYLNDLKLAKDLAISGCFSSNDLLKIFSSKLHNSISNCCVEQKNALTAGQKLQCAIESGLSSYYLVILIGCTYNNLIKMIGSNQDLKVRLYKNDLAFILREAENGNLSKNDVIQGFVGLTDKTYYKFMDKLFKTCKSEENSTDISSKRKSLLNQLLKNEDNKKSEDILQEIIDTPVYNNDENSCCVDILDSTYLKKVTYDELLKHTNPMYILKSTLFNIRKNSSEFSMTNEEINSLIRTGKLNIYDLNSSYEKISNHDMIIYLANMLYLQGYTPVIYTCDAETALDLVLMKFTVKSTYVIDEAKKCKNSTNDVVYFYDTCYFMEYVFDIDFSSNHHVFPLSMLEELLPNNEESKYFFIFLYLYNKYRENIEIIFTERSTQRKGRYSYTDLVHLFYCMNLSNSAKYKNKRVVLLTRDNQLFYEALSIPNFEVSSSQNIVDTKNEDDAFEEVSISSIQEVEENIADDEVMDYMIDDVKESEDTLETLSEKIKRITNNHCEIPFLKFNSMKLLCCDALEGIIEHVYDNNHMFRRFLNLNKNQKKKLKFTGDCYSIKIGYYISFKDNPNELYHIESFSSKTARIRKL